MKATNYVAMLAAVITAPTAYATASMSSADELSAIDVQPTEVGGTVILRGTHPPVFSVFRLSDPDRIIVDLAGADVSKVKAPDHAGIRGVESISAVQFQKGDTRVGRVVLTAGSTVAYDVKVVGSDVVVALSSGGPKASPVSVPAASPVQDGAPAADKSERVPEAAPAEDPHLLEKIVDKGHGGRVGHHVISASAETRKSLTLAVRTDGPVGDITLLRLQSPSRIAVDLSGFDAKGAKSRVGESTTAIRFGKTASGVRVVFDLEEGQNPPVVLRRTAAGLEISAKSMLPPATPVASSAPVSPAKKAEAAPETKPALVQPRPAVVGASASTVPAPAVAIPAVAKPAPEKVSASVKLPAPAPAPVAPAVAAAPKMPAAVAPAAMPSAKSISTGVVAVATAGKTPAELRDLRVTGDSTQQEIVLEVPAGTIVGQPKTVDGNGYELSLHGITVPQRLRRTLDAAAFSGPVVTVSSFNLGQAEGRVVVSAVAGSKQKVEQDGTTVTWHFSKPVRAASVETDVSVDVPRVASAQTEQGDAQVAGFTTAVGDNGTELPRRTHYTGRRISLEFKDIDIQNLLRLFADISHKNIVVADNVKGKITIALRNVPWDQAFDLILKTHGLGKEEAGNIVRVAPEDELEKERKAALDAKKAKDLLEPLRVRLIPVNYALAGDVADKIKDVLSERGVVTVDTRTNVLIVKDVPDNLAKAEGMVRNLDTQTPQVLIESRIVEASTLFNREVGIQWGGNAGFAPVNGNSTGLIFPNTATVAGAAGGTPNAGTAANPNFAVNLPAAIGQGAGGGLGFIFGSAGGAVDLNLRISALENNGIVKTVSAPKVATLDNQEATISQGVSIPFAQVSAAGVQTAFIEARLELKVTPHVTSDGSVLLKISATNNQPNSGITGANGQPSISRKEAKTQMLVRDGDTSVIGGIYTRQTGVTVNQVPLFGSIPILGWLFKHRADSDSRTELLVFITPRILNRQQIVASGN